MKKSILFVLIMFVSVNVFCAALKSEKMTRTHNLMEVLRLVEDFDTMAAVEYLNSRGGALETAKQYSQVVKDLYWKNRISELVVIGRCGMQYCYLKAQGVKDPKLKNQLMGWAKTIAYDVGANTWPGWGDKGIRISDCNRRSGLDFSRTNLRLAHYLKKGNVALGNAHWLLGAHYLIDGKYTHAVISLMKARRKFKKTGKTEYILMADGYIAIVEFVRNPSRHGGDKLMDTVIKLKALETPDADFFATQLEKVFRFVTRRVKK